VNRVATVVTAEAPYRNREQLRGALWAERDPGEEPRPGNVQEAQAAVRQSPADSARQDKEFLVDQAVDAQSDRFHWARVRGCLVR
jgi:hypothetical protein